MKLKKLMALAMSGVLAVSMFAGCAEKTGDTTEGDNNGVVYNSPLVSAVNDAQDKIDFTSDNSLTNALKKAVAEVGADNDADESVIKEYVEHTTGNVFDDALLPNGKDEGKDGEVNTIVKVVKVESKDAWTNEAVVANVAKSVKDYVTSSELADTTFVKYQESIVGGIYYDTFFGWVVNNSGEATAEGDEYRNYSYTGTVSDLVSVTSMDGSTNYYVAYTVSQTTAVLTY